MKVLIVANSLLPAYGGPAYSVSRLAGALSDAGATIGLWAADQSAVDTPLLPARSAITRLGGSEAEALETFGRPDVLHDNGIWMPHHHRYASLTHACGIPRVVSTRGMLEPWALSHKRFKKRIAWWLYQGRDLKRAVRHHVTADAEALSVRALGLDVPLCLIPNGVDVPDRVQQAKAAADRVAKKALFLGRIYPVKGLPMLIEAWAQVRPEGWLLEIAGPDEAGHRRVVEQAVADRGLGGVVSFLGPLQGSAKSSALFDADLFVLPTHSESFGMAIGEALAHGLPVLTTTAAPWPLLEERGCGWSVKPSADGIAAGLRTATTLERTALRERGARGRELVLGEFSWEHAANEFIRMYESVRGGGGR